MTLLPIRITGGPTPAGGELPPSGLLVEYESPGGRLWELTAPGADRWKNLFLLPGGLSGLSGRVEWEEVETVTGYGVRPANRRAWRTPPFDVTLTLGMRAPRGELESLSRRWERDWSGVEPGTLILRSVAGGRFEASVTDAVFPDWPSNLNNLTYLETSVTARVRAGHYLGKRETWGPGTHTIRVKGHDPLSPSCRLVWDGQATSVTFPSGITVTLPAVTGGTRYINMDRGMMGQVTKPDGTVDSVVWSALQSSIKGITLTPSQQSTWTLGSGLQLHVTPRYISPWR